mmetsp:Transcript_144533/g.463138  ORF Transcript_144533/g.463138 Transcript_144533/m.463138 type:complete len:290 (-) Transcript_144533:580-1449(-)
MRLPQGHSHLVRERREGARGAARPSFERHGPALHIRRLKQSDECSEACRSHPRRRVLLADGQQKGQRNPRCKGRAGGLARLEIQHQGPPSEKGLGEHPEELLEDAEGRGPALLGLIRVGGDLVVLGSRAGGGRRPGLPSALRPFGCAVGGPPLREFGAGTRVLLHRLVPNFIPHNIRRADDRRGLKGGDERERRRFEVGLGLGQQRHDRLQEGARVPQVADRGALVVHEVGVQAVSRGEQTLDGLADGTLHRARALLRDARQALQRQARCPQAGSTPQQHAEAQRDRRR